MCCLYMCWGFPLLQSWSHWDPLFGVNSRQRFLRKSMCGLRLFCNVYLFMCHDEHWICPFLACFIVPLCHTAEIFSKCCLPNFGSFRIIHQPFVAWYGFSRGWMYHWQRKVRKILDIVFVHYWDEFSRHESRWGCKRFLHCHCVECLLANQSCTCSCPPTQHSVRGNDNHWWFGGADPVPPAGCWCWSCTSQTPIWIALNFIVRFNTF